LPKSGGIISEH